MAYLPHAAFNGVDSQLDTAINYLLEKIETEPVPLPPPPTYPNLRFDYRRITNPGGRDGRR